MQKITITGLVMLFALSLLVSGCAKKASEDTGLTEDTTLVEVDQKLPSTISDQEVKDTDEPQKDLVAEARAAELAASKGLVRIQFDFDQYVLTASAKSILVSNGDLLKAAPAVQVLIEGHCDERGSDEYNLALGEKRALATKSYLVSLGVAADRMSVISYGEEMPIDAASTKDAWAKNRRANFKVKR